MGERVRDRILLSGLGDGPAWPACPSGHSFIYSFIRHTHTHTPYPHANPQLLGTGDNTMNKVDQIPVLTELTFYPVVLTS